MDYYIYRPKRDGRLSWLRWLPHSGQFTHKVVTCEATKWAQGWESPRRPQTDILATEPRHQQGK